MGMLKEVKPEAVFRYFEEICAVPRGSGNRDGICAYCLKTAEKLGLRAVSDENKNVIIYKEASAGYENAEPVILQGHLDMVCQKTAESGFDFERDAICPHREGDWIFADGTTLGADNGIAVAMIFAVLEDQTLSHPPLEVLLTADEEIGLLGATAVSGKWFSGKRMINLDSEEEERITVSCAGGCDVCLRFPLSHTEKSGFLVTLSVSELLGGHSGVEIDKGRLNANLLLGRILNHLKTPFSIVKVNGGDKGNAIPPAATGTVLVSDATLFCREVEEYWKTVREEIADREPNAKMVLKAEPETVAAVLDETAQERLLFLLTCSPNGVQAMSCTIDGLVETSLNLGIVKTEEEAVNFLFSLRSNKRSALTALEEKIFRLANSVGADAKTEGFYPPWEYRKQSDLCTLCARVYERQHGEKPQIVAIHAGLECGILSDKIAGLDCISIGPDMENVHTVHERLSISSTENTYALLTELLKECK